MPGVYAIKVSGQLPDEIRSSLEDEYRIQYIPYVHFHHGIIRHDTTRYDTLFVREDGKERVRWLT